MAKQKRRKPKPQQRSAEPTVAQQREEWRRAKAEDEALEELGLMLDLGGREPPKYDIVAGADARDQIDRLELLLAYYRWTVLTGTTPLPEDWSESEDWPHPDVADALFGSWDALVDSSRIEDGLLIELVDKALDAHAKLKARGEELDRRARGMDEGDTKSAEVRRQAELAGQRRDEAIGRAQEAEGARDRGLAENQRLRERLAALEEQLATEQPEAAAPPPDFDDWLQGFEQQLAAQSATEAARDELHTRLEELASERERDRQTIAELSRLLAAADTETDGAGPQPEEAEEPPATVLEAVERAAEQATHLRFAPRAFETAADSPFRRPGLVLKTLRLLDQLAARFEAGDMGMSLSQAAAGLGITQYKQNVSELARTRYEKDYTFSYEGRELLVGPHVGLGSGSGASFVARIYMHAHEGGDGLDRGLIVAVVGRHLPDTTT
jgi:uncharacterized coiled-coil protein SlyX